MKTGIGVVLLLALAFMVLGVTMTGAKQAGAGRSLVPSRPQGPCDIYVAAGTPCVAAHSTTRALYAGYNGPLYQIKRQSDSKILDIGVDPGGYANAAAQDAFCANTICVINRIYDQSGKTNHLFQAPPGPQFPGPAKGAFDAQPIAAMAPITVGGHKVYGVFVMPGMGFRNNNARDIAIGDEPEGIYYVVDGTHYDSGCCFDYGNSSTNGRAVGTGTMETTYYGTATAWGSGNGPGPWIMADMEAGLFSGYNAKQNVADPTIDSWRFVTAVVDGGDGNKWDLRGGNAQKGALTTLYNGVRPGSMTNNSYYPMHKQGGILLGTGGDNGNGSSGTFYEGAMTTGYPTEVTTDAVQANIVAARYDVQRVSMSRHTTFTPRSAQNVTVTFTNTTEEPVADLKLSVSAPAGWSVLALDAGNAGTSSTAVGMKVTATFKVTSPAAPGAGFMTAKAEWTNSKGKQSETLPERVRNVLPIKINEVRFNAGANATDQFIELYNGSATAVDLSNWAVINTQSQWAPVKLATMPAGTRLASGAFYLLGLSTSGLAAPANGGATTIHVRSVTGILMGQKIDVDGEARTIVGVGTEASAMTTVFIPVSTGPWIAIPSGATRLPVTNTAGFTVGQKVGIDIGGNYEIATVTAVGKAGTQTTLSAPVAAGATNIKIAANSNISDGDVLTVGTGQNKELATVARVGTPGVGGSGVDLTTSLRFDHASGIDVSDAGTGIAFAPATKFPHTSGDAVQALGSGITLDRPLQKSHAHGAPVVNSSDISAGYQGPPAPNQWFGGPISNRAGSIALMDATGAIVVDAIVYGSQQSSSSANGYITSPELATLEADQEQGGCIAVVPSVGRGAAPVAAGSASRSLGRFPDGFDADSLCTDFMLQSVSMLSVASGVGAANIKVASVADFGAGQSILIDAGANQESAVIAAVGTSGGTMVIAATNIGATVIPVATAAGFAVNQTITVDTGTNLETAVVTSMSGGGRGGNAAITVSSPLRFAHSAGVQLSGSGITLAAALSRTHASNAQISAGRATPGAPNQYYKRR